MNRAGLAGRIDAVEHRMDSIEHRLDASFAALTAQIVQSNRETRDEIIATLRGEMRAMGESLSARMRESHDEMYALHALTSHRIDKIETAMSEGFAESRRHMLVLHEEVLSRFALLDEGRRS